MTTASVEPQRWPRSRWWVAVGTVLALQLLLIFALGERSPRPVRKPAAAPVMQLTLEGDSEWFALQNPALFSLPPQRRGFSGGAWLQFCPLEFTNAAWSEPPRWLILPADQLGVRFGDFVRTNTPPPIETVVLLEPELKTPAWRAVESILRSSTFHLAGGLVGRRLISPLVLTNFATTDLLTNSIVRLLVDARGSTVSAALLPPGSGSVEADRHALDLAKSARFDSAASPLALGFMVFEWETVPAPANP